jgi:DHA1 family multidrug resistance protein-like MFS transporter
VVRAGFQHYLFIFRRGLPFWGGLADRKGRKIMLLRSALGMAIVMLLMGLAQNIWQFLILRALLGLLGGFIPNANALIATQIPRHKSGWALGTLSTGAVSGALLGRWPAVSWPITGDCVPSSL